MNYLQRSIKIYEKASHEIALNSKVAKTLNNLGLYFMDMHKQTDAVNYPQ